jgi:hypothetical protein
MSIPEHVCRSLICAYPCPLPDRYAGLRQEGIQEQLLGSYGQWQRAFLWKLAVTDLLRTPTAAGLRPTASAGHPADDFGTPAVRRPNGVLCQDRNARRRRRCCYVCAARCSIRIGASAAETGLKVFNPCLVRPGIEHLWAQPRPWRAPGCVHGGRPGFGDWTWLVGKLVSACSRGSSPAAPQPRCRSGVSGLRRAQRRSR